ncbi:hypothetical protein [Roseibium sediminicola]|nr:hypothetical protein [Roseibium sp. CAU 1639]
MELSPFSQDTGVLRCPACDIENLHQIQVEAFERNEDAETGTHVLITGDNVHINQEIDGNPSPRRQGLLVRFRCEMCSASIRLKMYQHKGSTIMGMEYENTK